MSICGNNLEIVYRGGKPFGIRDNTGFLFFFRELSKYTGQDERYKEEMSQLNDLAGFLLKALEKAESR